MHFKNRKKGLRKVGEEADRPNESLELRRVYFKFYDRLLRYGSTITSQVTIVEDEIQELFVRLYLQPDQTSSIDDIEPYLYASLRNRILTRLRSESRRTDRNNRYKSLNPQGPSIQPAVEEDDPHLDKTEWLAARVADLPPRLREVVFLRYYRGLSYDEVATAMGVSKQVARNFAYRALKKLRNVSPPEIR